jgi:putative ABC transport system ATP-binding protein
MTENLIECISLTKKYQGKSGIITAVENADLTIGENQLVLIKGRSGSGKSTLLNLMCGLIKPTQGKVMRGNECVSTMSDDALSKLLSEKTGIIFQNFNLLPTYTVFENIEIALVPGKLNNDNTRNNILSLLDQFELKGKAELMPSELSAGQQQKVAIIRSLIRNPSVIFADEPTGSVDDITANEIMDHLVNLKNQKNVTLVIATHGNVPENVADRVYHIEKGRILN